MTRTASLTGNSSVFCLLLIVVQLSAFGVSGVCLLSCSSRSKDADISYTKGSRLLKPIEVRYSISLSDEKTVECRDAFVRLVGTGGFRLSFRDRLRVTALLRDLFDDKYGGLGSSEKTCSDLLSSYEIMRTCRMSRRYLFPDSETNLGFNASLFYGEVAYVTRDGNHFDRASDCLNDNGEWEPFGQDGWLSLPEPQ